MNDPAINLEAVARDDQLLTQLGSGLLPDTNDEAIRALYAWRTDLARDIGGATPDATRRANGVAPAIGIARVNGATRINGAALVNGARVNGVKRPADTDREPPQSEADLEPPRRRGRRRAMVAAIAVGLSGGLGSVAVAAADAQPGSPLWPITKVIYADTAADRQAQADAEAALAKAKKALDEGRVADAERYLDEADRRAGSVDSAEGEELENEVDTVREELKDRDGGDKTGDSPGGGSDNPTSPGTSVPTTPALPTPGADSKKGKDAEREGREERDGRDTRDDKPSPGSSSELSLDPDTGLITKQLPEL
ncbi:MAG: hypothetical protein ACRDTM_12785 [Micromonosporaceae bacterium]